MKCQQIITYSANGIPYPQRKELPITLEADEPRHLESGVINLYPDITYQAIEGFGGAMTETSAYLLSQMSPEVRKQALEKFFSAQGSRMKFVRVPIDSCDYSLEEYTAVKDPMADPELATFSLARDQKYILPVLKEAIALAEEPLSVLLSPWSPPACWKTPPIKPKNDRAVYGELPGAPDKSIDYTTPSRCNGGSLKPEYYSSWAKYLTLFVKAYLQEGIPVTMMSIQNESIAATNWDSCVWSAQEQKTFLRDHLYPQFEKNGLAGKVGIYIWDHNKERVLEYAQDILDEVTDKMIEGFAFHWYSGDHFEAVEMAGRKFPGKVLMLSECCGLHAPGRTGMLGSEELGKTPQAVEYEDAVAYAHDIIGNLNAGMSRWIDWNLCVDKDGGPRHVPGGFTASMIVNEDHSFRTNLTYDFVRHFSHYILPGAVRVGFSRCDSLIEMTAAKNPDGTVAVILLNKGNEDQGYAIRVGGRVIRVQLPARTLSTLILDLKD